jgi:hypothetical protein
MQRYWPAMQPAKPTRPHDVVLMEYCIRDHTMDLTCTVNELFTMHEHGRRIDGELPPPGSQTRVMRPSIAERPHYYSDPVLATWERFNLAAIDGRGIITITVARDPRQPRGPASPGPGRVPLRCGSLSRPENRVKCSRIIPL